MTWMRRIVVIGSIDQDEVDLVDVLPVPGATVRRLGKRIQVGGKGATQAVAAGPAGVVRHQRCR